MLNGKLWASSDINLVMQATMQGFKVIYLGDPLSLSEELKQNPNFVVSTALTPDYQALSLQVDGDENGFIQMYISQLNSKAAIDMLSLILVCLYRGTHIMFYLPQESLGLNFIQYLLQFIEMNYGIMTQTQTTQFQYKQEFNTKIAELLYFNNLITAQEFLIHADTLDDIMLKKLITELHPMVQNPKDIDQIMAWFSNYKDQLLKAQQPLINGIQYAGEVSDYGCY